MRGNAHCTFRTTPQRTKRFNNVRLTCLGSKGLVILSRGSDEEPEEVLSMEAVRVDVLADDTIDLEGIVCTDEDARTFHKCFVIFAPVLSQKEAA